MPQDTASCCWSFAPCSTSSSFCSSTAPVSIIQWQPPPAHSHHSSAAAPRIPLQAQHTPTMTGPQIHPPRNGPSTNMVLSGHFQVLSAAARPLRLVPAARTPAPAPPAPLSLRTTALAPPLAPASGLSFCTTAASGNKPLAPTRPHTLALAKPAQPPLATKGGAPTSRPNSTVPARTVCIADPLSP
ncbi:hypothetical protein LshimejAT787_0309410 [Lyophyllum shimeji]|uniref:Uncharacterized protein n=1 Tax=Lyophyllum shimeji TaxID=47721 RepID=A0A9P3UJ82_LYOSH|nr:hypothetical protein LshimejAT787_0309410 [Lyophyllum shimeji]